MLGIRLLFNMFIKSIKRLRRSLKKSKKHHAIASLFLKVTHPPMKTKDFHVFCVSGCCLIFSSFHEAIARDPKGTTAALKATLWDQRATTWRPLGPTLGPLGVGRTLGGSLSLSLFLSLSLSGINRTSGRYVKHKKHMH